SFVPAAFEDVLSGLPTSEQPYDHELRRGPSRARCSRFPASPCLHRSDRSAQGFAGADRFDDHSRVLAHSSVLARFCVNTLFGDSAGEQINLVSKNRSSLDSPRRWVLMVRSTMTTSSRRPWRSSLKRSARPTSSLKST